MKVSVIGGYMHDIGNETEYNGKRSEYIYGHLERLFFDLDVKEGITPMTPGAEILWAWILQTMNVPITAAIPSQGFIKSLNRYDFIIYEEILKHSFTTKMMVSTGPSVAWKDHHRNCWVINQSDLIIFVWNGANNSIANAFNYAKDEKKKETILINPDNYNK